MGDNLLLIRIRGIRTSLLLKEIIIKNNRWHESSPPSPLSTNSIQSRKGRERNKILYDTYKSRQKGGQVEEEQLGQVLC